MLRSDSLLSSHYPFSCPFIAPLNQSLNRSIDSTRLDSDQLLLSAGSESHCTSIVSASASASFGETKRSQAAPTQESARRVGAPMNDCGYEREPSTGASFVLIVVARRPQARPQPQPQPLNALSLSFALSPNSLRYLPKSTLHGTPSQHGLGSRGCTLPHTSCMFAVCSMSSCLAVASGERLRSTRTTSDQYMLSTCSVHVQYMSAT